ncbi:hypothetical protein JTE90_016701 [Oedothorax gibbosus]|uniref:Uncharacterized protein n=1 Tax=Oedothorax gibbosus TaxID=931172 RepID=A0AAV6V3D3_9ARAC|nr:hypothetical protein JTE90_016701 [Oedothorax gibbosus]
MNCSSLKTSILTNHPNWTTPLCHVSLPKQDLTPVQKQRPHPFLVHLGMQETAIIKVLLAASNPPMRPMTSNTEGKVIYGPHSLPRHSFYMQGKLDVF